jgi:hypothetical protein
LQPVGLLYYCAVVSVPPAAQSAKERPFHNHSFPAFTQPSFGHMFNGKKIYIYTRIDINGIPEK